MSNLITVIFALLDVSIYCSILGVECYKIMKECLCKLTVHDRDYPSFYYFCLGIKLVYHLYLIITYSKKF